MQSSQSPNPIRWGIISTANIGVKAVTPAIRASSNGRLVAVASRDARRAAEVYSFAPGISIYDNYESILNDSNVDAVYIPLPNGLHAEWTIQALRAGKHVLCEKPLSVTAREGKIMADVAQENNVLLMEAFMYRFHPQIVWAIEQVNAGLIGLVRLVRASFSFDIRSHSDDIRLKPELAGGALMDTGCYTVNMCRAVYGHAPLVVAARVHTTSSAGVDMATNAVLDFGEGRFGLVDCSFELPTRQMVEIIGETGTITIPVPFTPGNIEAIILILKNGELNEQKFNRIDQYQLEVEHFANCIRTGQEPMLRLSETLENMATIEAMYQAAGHDWPLV
ncbi:MAG: Gfo/Idh/MocA family oxidoreductase [Ktedonobacteraceae bacterium]